MTDALAAADSTLFFMINGHHCRIADWFFLAVTQLGNSWVVAPVLIGIILRKVPRNRVVSVIIGGTLALAISGIVNSQVKHTVGRQRPYFHFRQENSGGSPDTPVPEPSGWRGKTHTPTVRLLGPKYRNRSFPSGHTNTAFSAATLLVWLFGGRWCPAFAVALLVGYSRVYRGVHFPADVVAGGILGILISLAVLELYRFFRGRVRG